MSKQWSWFRPSGPDEVADLLSKYGSEALLVAGGTALCVTPPRKDRLALIDLQQAGLSFCADRPDAFQLGAMVTARELLQHEALEQLGSGLLRQTARTMGPQPVRNRVTVGGNVMQTFRWSDLPVSLLALGAQFELRGPAGASRLVGADDLFVRQPARSLQPGELLRSVLIEKDGPHRGGAFLKLSLREPGHALASVAVVLSLAPEDSARCQDIRVVAGAVAPLPQRLHAVEALLAGRVLDDQALAEARQAAGSCRVAQDRRADEDYQRQVIGVLVQRAIEQAAQSVRQRSREVTHAS